MHRMKPPKERHGVINPMPPVFLETALLSVDDKVGFTDFAKSRGVSCGILPVKFLSRYATAPTYGSAGAAGLDLYADMSLQDDAWPSKCGPTIDDLCVTIHPGAHKMIHTGVAIAVPKGHYGQIAPRSGLAIRHGIAVYGGVIDEDYRGEVSVILGNGGRAPFRIQHGNRIGQLLIIKHLPCYVHVVPDLSETERGEGAFGSTGR